MADEVLLCNKCLGTGKAIDRVVLGAEYRRQRKAKGISLTEMAKRMSCSKALLCQMEKGYVAFSTTYALAFQAGLDE
jgi:hypothetical protein